MVLSNKAKLRVSVCEAGFSGAAGDIRGGFNRFLYTVYNVQMSRNVLHRPDIFLESDELI